MNEFKIKHRIAIAIAEQQPSKNGINKATENIYKILEEQLRLNASSLQLKDKYSEDFAYFVEKKVREQPVGSIYWYKDTGYTSLDKLFKEYQTLTKPLIV